MPEENPQPPLETPPSLLVRLLRGLSKVKKDPSAKSELLQGATGALPSLEKIQPLADVALASDLAVATGEVGMTLVKGAPFMIVGGLTCPLYAGLAFAATLGCAFLKAKNALNQADQSKRTQDLTATIKENLEAIGTKVNEEAERLGLNGDWNGRPEELATLIVEAFEATREDADSRAVRYLDVLKQSNREMQFWFKDYLDRNFSDISGELGELTDSIQEARTELATFITGSERRHQELLQMFHGVTDQSAYVVNLVPKTYEFIEKRATRFYGRDSWLAENFGWVDRGEVPSDRAIAITAPPGSGKSSVMAELVRRGVESRRWTVAQVFFRPDWRNGTHAEAGYISLIGALRRTTPNMPEQARYSIANVDMGALPGELSRELARAALRRPVLLILDGLDECREPSDFKREWLQHLTEAHPNVVLVTGYRRDHEEAPPNYAKPCTHRITLPALDVAGIQDWLTKAGDGELAKSAKALAPKIREAAQGLPLLVEYLIKELEIDPTRAGSASLPKGLEDYVAKEVERLMADSTSVATQLVDVLRLLSHVRQPLPIEALRQIVDIRREQIHDERVPAAVRRWWNRLEDGEAFAFAHPLLAQVFRKDRSLDATLMLAPLANWCASRETGYAFDWGVIHMVEACRFKWNEEWAEEAVRRVTSLEYVQKKLESNQEGQLHRELEAVQQLLEEVQ